MIAKVVRRDKGKSSFWNLSKYILDARKQSENAMWERLSDYILAVGQQGKKVACARITNCESDIPALAMLEVRSVQEENTRSKADKTYHLVVSFPEGEIPDQEQLKDIEARICEELGYGEHQRLSAVHRDTDNLHLHIAINKVHPKKFTVHEPYYPYYKLDRLCQELEKKHGLNKDNRIGQSRRAHYRTERPGEKALDAEALQQWIKAEVGGPLKTLINQPDTGWQEVHTLLARFGLEIRLKGAGLTLAHPGSGCEVKPSSVDRSFSFKAMTEKLGIYEPPGPEIRVIQPEKPFVPAPGWHEKTEALYLEYQQERTAVMAEKQALKTELKAYQEEFYRHFKSEYARKREAVRTERGLTRYGKQQLYQGLARERERMLSGHWREVAERRERLAELPPVPVWQDFLMSRAEMGDEHAVTVLRAGKNRKRQFSLAVLTADNVEGARQIVHAHLKPRARLNGDLVYRVKDGGLVVDESERIRVDEVSAGAVFLAVSLADARFQGRPLIVDGSGTFQRQVVHMAAQYGLAVTFKDPALEAERQTLYSSFHEKAPEPEGVALEAYIRHRNALLEKFPDAWLPHRAWRTGRERGKMSFRGKDTLSDGREILIWQKGDEMIVKPVESPEESEQANQWRYGQLLDMNAPDDKTHERKSQDRGWSR